MRKSVRLRAVTSEDAMTADWYRFPPEVLQTRLPAFCNEVSGVNRVLYDIHLKPRVRSSGSDRYQVWSVKSAGLNATLPNQRSIWMPAILVPARFACFTASLSALAGLPGHVMACHQA